VDERERGRGRHGQNQHHGGRHRGQRSLEPAQDGPPFSSLRIRCRGCERASRAVLRAPSDARSHKIAVRIAFPSGGPKLATSGKSTAPPAAGTRCHLLATRPSPLPRKAGSAS
jgi:hypothetical protein